MKFLGIDLGWSSGASGVCCLEWRDLPGQTSQRDRTLILQDLRRIDAIADILTWIDTCIPASESGVIAVDAPTIIPNATGMRVCDRLAHQQFGRYHAGCYPANLGLPFASRTVGFGQSLEARGFQHQPDSLPQPAGRYQLEVFPHPATIRLFGLQQILKYKKGKVAERRTELAKLRSYISTTLPQLEPRLEIPSLPDIPVVGTQLKAVEDQIDSLICAYVAAHWWYWGLEKNQILGDRTTGYIVVPHPSA